MPSPQPHRPLSPVKSNSVAALAKRAATSPVAGAASTAAVAAAAATSAHGQQQQPRRFWTLQRLVEACNAPRYFKSQIEMLNWIELENAKRLRRAAEARASSSTTTLTAAASSGANAVFGPMRRTALNEDGDLDLTLLNQSSNDFGRLSTLTQSTIGGGTQQLAATQGGAGGSGRNSAHMETTELLRPFCVQVDPAAAPPPPILSASTTISTPQKTLPSASAAGSSASAMQQHPAPAAPPLHGFWNNNNPADAQQQRAKAAAKERSVMSLFGAAGSSSSRSLLPQRRAQREEEHASAAATTLSTQPAASAAAAAAASAAVPQSQQQKAQPVAAQKDSAALSLGGGAPPPPPQQQSRYFLPMTLTDFAKLATGDVIPQAEQHFYEIIQEFAPCVLYFDLEMEPHMALQQRELDELRKEWRLVTQQPLPGEEQVPTAAEPPPPPPPPAQQQQQQQNSTPKRTRFVSVQQQQQQQQPQKAEDAATSAAAAAATSKPPWYHISKEKRVKGRCCPVDCDVHEFDHTLTRDVLVEELKRFTNEILPLPLDPVRGAPTGGSALAGAGSSLWLSSDHGILLAGATTQASSSRSNSQQQFESQGGDSFSITTSPRSSAASSQRVHQDVSDALFPPQQQQAHETSAAAAYRTPRRMSPPANITRFKDVMMQSQKQSVLPTQMSSSSGHHHHHQQQQQQQHVETAKIDDSCFFVLISDSPASVKFSQHYIVRFTDDGIRFASNYDVRAFVDSFIQYLYERAVEDPRVHRALFYHEKLDKRRPELVCKKPQVVAPPQQQPATAPVPPPSGSAGGATPRHGESRAPGADDSDDGETPERRLCTQPGKRESTSSRGHSNSNPPAPGHHHSHHDLHQFGSLQMLSAQSSIGRLSAASDFGGLASNSCGNLFGGNNNSSANNSMTSIPPQPPQQHLQQQPPQQDAAAAAAATASSVVEYDYKLPAISLRCIIDEAVYTKNRMMRCYGSSKLGKKATLMFDEEWYAPGAPGHLTTLRYTTGYPGGLIGATLISEPACTGVTRVAAPAPAAAAASSSALTQQQPSTQLNGSSMHDAAASAMSQQQSANQQTQFTPTQLSTQPQQQQSQQQLQQQQHVLPQIIRSRFKLIDSDALTQYCLARGNVAQAARPTGAGANNGGGAGATQTPHVRSIVAGGGAGGGGGHSVTWGAVHDSTSMNAAAVLQKLPILARELAAAQARVEKLPATAAASRIQVESVQVHVPKGLNEYVGSGGGDSPCRAGAGGRFNSPSREGTRTVTVNAKLQGTRFCHVVGRQHRSNGVYWIVKLFPFSHSGAMEQRCWDDDCRRRGFTHSCVLPEPAVAELKDYLGLSSIGGGGAGCGANANSSSGSGGNKFVGPLASWSAADTPDQDTVVMAQQGIDAQNALGMGRAEYKDPAMRAALGMAPLETKPQQQLSPLDAKQEAARAAEQQRKEYNAKRTRFSAAASGGGGGTPGSAAKKS